MTICPKFTIRRVDSSWKSAVGMVPKTKRIYYYLGCEFHKEKGKICKLLDHTPWIMDRMESGSSGYSFLEFNNHH